MPARLRDADIEAIVQVLDGWQGPLTWEALAEAAAVRVGCRYTRQALDRHDRIKLAYQVTKARLRTRSRKATGGTVEVQKLRERIERLEAANERLEAENNSLLEQFARWCYNAHVKGLSEACLDLPLPPIDRRKAR